ncbi:MAG: UDP-N-acetylmuramoyl-L-alanine--D-glutamate ligase [Flavobacteriales bacterium]|nr:UDP-N-acetylmuramoyl-L-alanine--D-glutamate ligase [Flavobacteriales bacterium]
MRREKVIIVGGGISGLGAAKLAVHQGYNTFVSNNTYLDQEIRNSLLDLGVILEEGSHNISMLDNTTLIVKSPGVPTDIPFLIEAKKRSIHIISEIEFAYMFTQSHIIAITGTNGKTTTATLLSHILKSAGFNVCLAGNMGKSFSECVLENHYSHYVLELSSFQLDDIKTFKPDIAILLNINRDHLDRYDHDIHKYINSKLKIQMNQTEEDKFIYFSQDSHIDPHLLTIKAEKYSFGKTNILATKQGAWIQDNKIIINTIKNNFTMTIHNLALQGTHNIYNSMAASIAASTLGIKNEMIKKSLSDFQGVEHRLEFVGKVSGVKYINDSKATNCNAVYYALDSIASPIIWICGGVDKGNNYDVLKDLVSNKVKSIICLGNNTASIESSFKSIVSNIFTVNTMQEAVRCSHSNADVGDTVLLSPACASFDLFKNYEERGHVFKSCVLEI